MSIHIHLGAHKTASTHIQAILRKNRARLAEAGVAQIGPEEVRRLVRSGRRAAARMAPAPSLRAYIARLRLGRAAGRGARTVLSDENSLGGCAEMIAAGALYPHAAARLKVLKRAARREGAVISLAVRDYGAFFSGVHAQAVRNADYLPIDLARVAALPRRWTDIAAEIQEMAPNAPLLIWDYADYPALCAEILRRMTGLDELEPVHRRPMATPSGAAMAALAEGAAWETAIAMHPVSPETPRYAPWSAEAAAGFSAAFAEDLAKLRQTPGVEVLRV